MGLVVEPGQRVVGLGLEIGRLDAPLGARDEARHARAPDEVGDERGDEDGLSRPRQPGDPEADHRLEERLRDGRERPLDAARQPVCDVSEDHVPALLPWVAR